MTSRALVPDAGRDDGRLSARRAIVRAGEILASGGAAAWSAFFLPVVDFLKNLRLSPSNFCTAGRRSVERGGGFIYYQCSLHPQVGLFSLFFFPARRWLDLRRLGQLSCRVYVFTFTRNKLMVQRPRGVGKGRVGRGGRGGGRSTTWYQASKQAAEAHYSNIPALGAQCGMTIANTTSISHWFDVWRLLE